MMSISLKTESHTPVWLPEWSWQGGMVPINYNLESNCLTYLVHSRWLFCQTHVHRFLWLLPRSDLLRAASREAVVLLGDLFERASHRARSIR